MRSLQPTDALTASGPITTNGRSAAAVLRSPWQGRDAHPPDFLIRSRAVPIVARQGSPDGTDQIGKIVVFPRTTTVIEQNGRADHVFKVVTGVLRAVRLLPDGRRYIARFLLPGDVFGFTNERQHHHAVEAISAATLIRYSHLDLERAMDGDPQAGRRLFSLVCRQLSAADDHLMLLGRKGALERLAAFLLALTKAEPDAAGAVSQTIELPMNRSDIADYLGLTIETVSRMLTRLRQWRIIDLPSIGHVALLKPMTLHAISEGRLTEAELRPRAKRVRRR